MATALVIGASGQVGRHTSRALRELGWTVVGTGNTRVTGGLRALELTDGDRLRALIREVRPALCVVSGAMTNVERCESEPGLAEMLNTRAPAIAAEAVRAVGGRTVHVSTEYVFDGIAGPYDEDAPVRPISIYGRTKLDAERAVLAVDTDNLIVRTTVVFSHAPGDRNFLMQLIDRLGRGERMRVPSDQISNPTYAPWLGDTIAELAPRTEGVLHAVGPERLDRHAFALRAAGRLNLDASLLEPVVTSVLGQQAARPLNAGLRIERLRALGISPPSLDASLREVARLSRL